MESLLCFVLVARKKGEGASMDARNFLPVISPLSTRRFFIKYTNFYNTIQRTQRQSLREP